MFESLFGEDGDDPFPAGVDQTTGNSRVGLKAPPAPRNKTGLSGLSNLGATCYLNSLLQTLHFTSEFRDSLFGIGEGELGQLKEEDGADNSQVRVIPVQLQILFSRLLLLNQQSCGVDGLVSSFGWTNNEELQQHDVQELNRILFAAIESSLVGTRGETLIGQLYRGTSVQQVLLLSPYKGQNCWSQIVPCSEIVCQTCGYVSEREEDFLDLPVALTGRSDLRQALREMFVNTELLDGPNQYHCCRCNTLVDAKRECRLRKLPPILTFALLRFLYDFKKGERYKDTSNFRFPLEIDMTPYSCGGGGGGGGAEAGESGGVGGGEVGGGGGGGGSERVVYELYSVVIHSGSTHSGHYTVYIRDVDNLGCWTHPEDDPVLMTTDENSGKVDYIEFDTPTELLVTLLKGLGNSSTIDKLCKSMQEKTGVTWNKRFKKQFGSIQQFLKNCPDFFVLDETRRVSLKTTPPATPTTVSPMEMSPGRQEEECMDTTDPAPPPTSSKENEGERDDPDTSLRENQELTQLSVSTDNPPPTVPDDCREPQQDGVLQQDLVSGTSSSSSSSAAAGPSGDGSRYLDHGGGIKLVAMGTEGSKSKPTSKAKGECRHKEPPPPGERWFHFNDIQVSPAIVKSLERMYQGKESAYMLFYRRKNKQQNSTPIHRRNDVIGGIPQWLKSKVTMENTKLEEEKLTYDVVVNTITLNVHLSSSHTFYNGALHPKQDAMVTTVSIDRRKSLSELETVLEKELPGHVRGHVISVARKLPAGMHIYDSLSRPIVEQSSQDSRLQDRQLLDGSNLFIWDGKQVGGVPIRTGTTCEPVLLKITCPRPSVRGEESEEEEEEGEETEGEEEEEEEVELGRAKDSTLGDLRVLLGGRLGVPVHQVRVSQVKVSSRSKSSSVVVLHSSKDKLTLEQLKLCDGDKLAAEAFTKKGRKTLAHTVADKQNSLLSVIVEDRCSPSSTTSYPVHAVEISKDTLLSTFKSIILSRLKISQIHGRWPSYRVSTMERGSPLYPLLALHSY